MNPFSNFDLSRNDAINYTSFVAGQVEPLLVGDSIRADIGCKDFQSFRMTLSRLQSTKLQGAKFKTKVSGNDLWVMRIE